MNPILKAMGFDERDRVVITHADDIGMCRANVEAFLDLRDYGLVTCGSAMAPCSWFPEIARYAKGKPELDLGLHLTHTCEHATYRWRPLSTVDPKSGLIDDEGYFNRSPKTTMSNATPESVAAETEVQIRLALKLGIELTHLDSHHGIMMFGKDFQDDYISIARKFKLLPAIMKIDPHSMNKPSGRSGEKKDYDKRKEPKFDFKAVTAGLRSLSEKAENLQKEGVPVIDNMESPPLESHEDRLGQMKMLMNNLPSGLTHFAFHPVKDSPEIRAITPDWRCRVADYEVFLSKELKDHFRDKGIHTVGYKDLAEYLPW
jgi:chitin disaccharide deacetylase